METRKIRRGVYILPNLFTSASLFAGFYGMILAVQGNITGCAVAILFGALMDGCDGKVARLTHTASEFGLQYDSLADLISFGVAPGFMAWIWQLHQFGSVGICASLLFVTCTALRLARFNVSTAVVGKRFFVGLPSPSGGCMLALFVLFSPYLPNFLAEHTAGLMLILTVSMGFLMISTVRYFSFKEFGFLREHPFRYLVGVLLLFLLVLSEPRLFAFLIALGYVLGGILYTLRHGHSSERH
ncbi:MAG: CDP-diacylglycerol--serine O-phosphatidyltransferase [Desulfovibrionaceae bacterium]|nr:CDP-diacylglycerol--serine O-phosphatidyltransferase [Desulfovibrionaceae bacterium]